METLEQEIIELLEQIEQDCKDNALETIHNLRKALKKQQLEIQQLKQCQQNKEQK